MKKLLLALMMLAGTQAFAATSPLWTCRMGFEGEAKGLQLLVGSYNMEGTGELSCYNVLGETKTIPIKVSIKSTPLAAVIAFGAFDVYGQSADIALFAENPEDLLGKYLVAQGQAAVVGGIGSFVATHAHLPELALKISLQFLRGFGLQLGVSAMTIEAI